MEDYSQLLREVVTPEVMETVFVKEYDQLKQIATEDNRQFGGASITVPVRTSISSNAAAYDKSDVNPAAGTFVGVDATWTKVYHHTAFEVHGIDKSQAMNGGQPSIANLIQDAAAMEMDQLMEVIYDSVWTQVRADIDSSGTAYSDASLSRSTYATLASTEETTDTPITLQLLRTHANTVLLNKMSNKNEYQWIMESAVFNRFEPLVAMLHTWQAGGPGYASGFQSPGSFESVPVYSPKGLTTGDVFFLRKRDFKIKKHREFEIEQVASGRDSAKFVMRVGINAWVENPGFCGKMYSKD